MIRNYKPSEVMEARKCLQRLIKEKRSLMKYKTQSFASWYSGETVNLDRRVSSRVANYLLDQGFVTKGRILETKGDATKQLYLVNEKGILAASEGEGNNPAREPELIVEKAKSFAVEPVKVSQLEVKHNDRLQLIAKYLEPLTDEELITVIQWGTEYLEDEIKQAAIKAEKAYAEAKQRLDDLNKRFQGGLK